MDKEKDYRFYVVEFSGEDLDSLEQYACVPNSWITRLTEGPTVLVKYPINKVSKQLVENGEAASEKWLPYAATIIHSTDCYQDATYFLKSVMKESFVQSTKDDKMPTTDEEHFCKSKQNYRSPFYAAGEMTKQTLSDSYLTSKHSKCQHNLPRADLMKTPSNAENYYEGKNINESYGDKNNLNQINESLDPRLNKDPFFNGLIALLTEMYINFEECQSMFDHVRMAFVQNCTNLQKLIEITNVYLTSRNESIFSLSKDTTYEKRDQTKVTEKIKETDKERDVDKMKETAKEREIAKTKETANEKEGVKRTGTKIEKEVNKTNETKKESEANKSNETGKRNEVEKNKEAEKKVPMTEVAKNKGIKRKKSEREKDEDLSIRKRSYNELTFPPEYNEKDSRWTLKYQRNAPGLVELQLYTGVYVKEANLESCLRKSNDSTTLARLLLVEVFTENALSLCTWTGVAYNAFKKHKPRPGLDEEARNVLLNYVYKCECYNGWNKVDQQIILNSIRNKIRDYHRKCTQY